MQRGAAMVVAAILGLLVGQPAVAQDVEESMPLEYGLSVRATPAPPSL
jgi:hypothetical protein